MRAVNAADAISFHVSPIAGIEAMSACTARAFPRHTHDQFGIGVVDAGGHASWSGRGQVEAGPGQFIAVNPGEVHDGRAVGRKSRSWRILYLEPAVMHETCADILEGRPASFAFARPAFADDSLRPMFEAAFAARERMAFESALVALVAQLGRHATPGVAQAASPAACIQRVRAWIDDDPAAELTLSALAREAGLSRYQLIRAFARELNMTPHAYLMQRRVALARRLIRKGHALADVATAAGFCDQSHLARCFVRQLGVPPGRYARSCA